MNKNLRYLFLVSTLLVTSSTYAYQVEGNTIRLTIAAGTPGRSNVCSGFLKNWATRVEQQSHGRLKLDLICDSVLGNVGNTFERVSYGVADLGWDIPALYGRRFEVFNLITLPGLYDDPGRASMALWSLYQRKIIQLNWGNTKPVWFQASQNTAFYLKSSPRDNVNFSGLKIASGSQLRAQLTDDAAGVPVSLRVTEYYQALNNGAVNGLLTTPGALEASGILRMIKYAVTGPFGGGMTALVINKETYAALPEDLKKIIDNNSGATASRLVSDDLNNYENRLTQKIFSQEGTHISVLSVNDLKLWDKRYSDIRNNWAKSIQGGDYILKSFSSALEKTEN